MININAHVSSVTLYHVDGVKIKFASKAKALKTLGIRFIQKSVRIDFRYFSHTEWRTTKVLVNGKFRSKVTCQSVLATCDYILRDDCGNKLTESNFYPTSIYADPHQASWPTRAYGYYCGYGPVPGVHKPSSGHMFRRLKTMNAVRQSVVIEDDIAPRAKRSSNTLPDSWDDHMIGAYSNRNWKRQRKTQWK